MDKAESKYYNTSLLFNQALIELLNKKEYEYITVKEICAKAGVNRSTFYLHYDTIDELLEEAIENSTKRFLEYFPQNTEEFFGNFNNLSADDLIFITPKYLTPYLNYIKENKVFHQVATKHNLIMKSTARFNSLNNFVFKPILKKFGIDEKSAGYMITYYLNGTTAIINEWIKNNCADPIEYIEDLIISCIRPNLKMPPKDNF